MASCFIGSAASAASFEAGARCDTARCSVVATLPGLRTGRGPLCGEHQHRAAAGAPIIPPSACMWATKSQQVKMELSKNACLGFACAVETWRRNGGKFLCLCSTVLSMGVDVGGLILAEPKQRGGQLVSEPCLIFRPAADTCLSVPDASDLLDTKRFRRWFTGPNLEDPFQPCGASVLRQPGQPGRPPAPPTSRCFSMRLVWTKGRRAKQQLI